VSAGGAKFVPTEIGFVVADLLIANFPYIFDPQYTANSKKNWTISKTAGGVDHLAGRFLWAF